MGEMPDVLVSPLFAFQLLIVFLLLWSGCAGSGKKFVEQGNEPRKDAPPWALTGNSPHQPGLVCAVGIAGPTFFRFDAVETASDAARSALARTFRVQILASTIDIQTTEGGGRDSQTVVQVASHVNDMVLERSRIVEMWYDEWGTGFVKKPQYTYALACMDEASVSAGPGIR